MKMLSQNYSVIRSIDFLESKKNILNVIDSNFIKKYIDSDAKTIVFNDVINSDLLNIDELKKNLGIESEHITIIAFENEVSINNLYSVSKNDDSLLFFSQSIECHNLILRNNSIFVTDTLKIKEVFYGHGENNFLKANTYTNETTYITSANFKVVDYEKSNQSKSHFKFVKIISENDIQSANFNSTNIIFSNLFQNLMRIFDYEILDESIKSDEIHSIENYFLFHNIYMRLSKGLSLLRTSSSLQNFLLQDPTPSQQVQFYDFKNQDDFQNQKELFSIIINSVDNYDTSFARLNLVKTDLHINQAHKRDSDGQNVPESLVFLCDDGNEFIVSLNTTSFLKIRTSANLDIIHRNLNKNKLSYSSIWSNSDSLDHFKKIWKEMISVYNLGNYYLSVFQHLATVDRISSVLSYSMIPKIYNDYWQYGKDGFWYGRLYFSFKRHQEADLPGSIDTSHLIEGRQFDFRRFYFRLEDSGSLQKVIPYYRSSQEGHSSDRFNLKAQPLWLWDTDLLHEACYMFLANLKFARIQQEIFETSEHLICQPIQDSPSRKNETIEYCGLKFKLYNRTEIESHINHLTGFDGIPLFDPTNDRTTFPEDNNGYFLVCEENAETQKLELQCEIENHADLFILGFVFKKSLIVEESIYSCDYDFGPVFIALEKVNVPNFVVQGNTYYVHNDLQCESIYGFYNHGSLYVKGQTTSWLIYSDDIRFHFNQFAGIAAAISACRPDISLYSEVPDGHGSRIYEEVLLPTTHFNQDILEGDFLTKQNDGSYKLTDDVINDIVIPSFSFINIDLQEHFEYAHIKKDLIKFFQKFKTILHQRKSNEITWGDDFENFKIEKADGRIYLSYTILKGFNILHQAWVNENNFEENKMTLAYLDQSSQKIKYQWTGTFDETDLMIRPVIYAIRLSYNQLENLSTDKS